MTNSVLLWVIQTGEEDEGSSGLYYSPMKPGSGMEKTMLSKNTLLSSHLLSNGAVGDKEEITEGTLTCLI